MPKAIQKEDGAEEDRHGEDQGWTAEKGGKRHVVSSKATLQALKTMQRRETRKRSDARKGTDFVGQG